MANSYKANCFCGEVEIEASGTPALMGYCHCEDCQAWSAAPINAFSLWPPESVRVTKGGKSLGSYSKTEHSDRKYCTKCGGHLMTDHPGMGLVDIYANVLQGFVHEPAVHVHYGHRMLSVRDGLPKYKDLPSDAGGSGETLPE